MTMPRDSQPMPPAASRPLRRWWPLVVVTAANYLWQIPYAVHQYGHRWDALTGLSIPLIITGLWFAVAALATVGGRRGGRSALVAFLVTEVTFYLVHNVSGAFAADLPLRNSVVLIASLLGYLSTATAGLYLILMVRDQRRTQGRRRLASLPSVASDIARR